MRACPALKSRTPKTTFALTMKKQILLAASVLFSTLSFAQSSPVFGIRGGVVSSEMRGDAVNSFESMLDFTGGAIKTTGRTGFYAGGFANIPVSDLISVEPGVYYSQKGYQLQGDLNLKGTEFLGVNAKAQLNTSYIDIPVVVKANLNGFQVFAGPQVSYLTRADLRTTAGALGFNVVDQKMDATSQMNRWDAGVTGGLGYQFSNGLQINASYDHGLSKVNSGKNLESYNRAFKVGVGLTF